MRGPRVTGRVTCRGSGRGRIIDTDQCILCRLSDGQCILCQGTKVSAAPVRRSGGSLLLLHLLLGGGALDDNSLLPLQVRGSIVFPEPMCANIPTLRRLAASGSDVAK